MNTLQVSRSVRFWFHQGNQVSTNYAWVALHGYGHSLTTFSPLLAPLVSNRQTILAPEALSRFYLKGTSGAVGATWMTSDNRELDIQDNHAYLDDITQYLKQQYRISRLVLLGFSQGCTTMLRWWMAKRPSQVASVVAWAGSFPHEYALQDWIHCAPETPLWIVAGKNDPYLQDSYIQFANSLAELRPNCRLVWFEGEHTIDPGTLSGICVEIMQQLA